jgi:hypothetical protein
MWRSNVGLADASGHAVGGALIKSWRWCPMPVTMNNLVLGGDRVQPRIHNCANCKSLFDPVSPRIVTNHDLDPGGGTDSLCSP